MEVANGIFVKWKSFHFLRIQENEQVRKIHSSFAQWCKRIRRCMISWRSIDSHGRTLHPFLDWPSRMKAAQNDLRSGLLVSSAKWRTENKNHVFFRLLRQSRWMTASKYSRRFFLVRILPQRCVNAAVASWLCGVSDIVGRFSWNVAVAALFLPQAAHLGVSAPISVGWCATKPAQWWAWALRLSTSHWELNDGGQQIVMQRLLKDVEGM